MSLAPPKAFTLQGGGAFAFLAAQHEELLALATELTGGAGAPHQAPRERKALAERLVIEASKHEAVEERCFWPVVAERLGEPYAKAALEQEADAKQTLHEFNHVTADNEVFAAMTRDVLSKLRLHVTYEQNQVWPKLRKALSDREVLELGEQMAAEYRLAPTRPHPHTPPFPSLLAVVAPLVGTTDRLRDVIVGRGRGVQGIGRLRAALVTTVVVGALGAGAVGAVVHQAGRLATPD